MRTGQSPDSPPWHSRLILFDHIAIIMSYPPVAPNALGFSPFELLTSPYTHQGAQMGVYTIAILFLLSATLFPSFICQVPSTSRRGSETSIPSFPSRCPHLSLLSCAPRVAPRSLPFPHGLGGSLLKCLPPQTASTLGSGQYHICNRSQGAQNSGRAVTLSCQEEGSLCSMVCSARARLGPGRPLCAGKALSSQWFFTLGTL